MLLAIRRSVWIEHQQNCNSNAREIIYNIHQWFLGATEYCQKRLLASPCLYLCPSVCTPGRPSIHLSKCDNTALTGRNFMKFNIWWHSENLSRKFVSIISDKNLEYFTWRPLYLYMETAIPLHGDHYAIDVWSYLAQFYLEREMLPKNLENTSKLTVLVEELFSKIYEVMCKNILEPDRPQITL